MEATLHAYGLRAVNGPLFLRHAIPPQGHPCQVSCQDGLPDALLARVAVARASSVLGSVDAPDERSAEAAARRAIRPRPGAAQVAGGAGGVGWFSRSGVKAPPCRSSDD
jgi:hypothetical protein